MVERDKVEYRDPTPFDESKLQSLQIIIDALLHKQDARDVRAPMAQMPDAIIKSLQDGANLGQLGALAELVAARGIFETLGLHETAQDNGIQTNAAAIQTARNTASYAIQIAKSSLGGSPRGFFKNVSELKAKYPNGAEGAYVTNDTGHVWIYNGEWQDVAIYQGTEVADKSVTNDKLANEVKLNGLDSTGGKVLISWSPGYVANKTSQDKGGAQEGTIVANQDYSITQPILVHNGDLIIVSGYIGSTASLISLWDINGTYISSLKDGVSNNERTIVTVPQSGYVRISNQNLKFDQNNVTVERYPQLSSYSLNGWLSGELDWHSVPLDWSARMYVGSDTNANYPNKVANNGKIDEQLIASKTFGVHAGTIVTVKGGIATTAYLLSEFDSRGQTFIKGILKGTGKAGTYTAYIDHSCYLRVSNDKSLAATPIISTKRTDSLLAGKTMNIIGDSYVENNTHDVSEAWHYKLAQKYAMTYNNYGHNGNGLITPNKNGTPVVERYNDMADGADYVVVIGGKNDYNDQFPLEDFKAGLITLIKGLVIKYPDAKLCFFTPWSLGDDEKQDIKLIDYAQAIEDTCNLFGVACFNSYKKSNITPWDANFRKRYMQADNDISHLNSAGHDRFLPKAEAFLNSL